MNKHTKMRVGACTHASVLEVIAPEGTAFEMRLAFPCGCGGTAKGLVERPKREPGPNPLFERKVKPANF